MRDILPGILAGLVVGGLGAFALTHYLDESRIDQLQADLDAARAGLVKVTSGGPQSGRQINDLSAEIQELTARNDELKQQNEAAKKAAVTAPPAAPGFNPMMFGDMMRGGQTQQRMLLLKSRLHLTPEQETAVNAALEADAKQRRDQMRQMFRGGNNAAAPAAPAGPTLDQTLAEILTPDQLTAYQQVQADEKTSQAETMATMRMDQMAPLLQLSDAQRDQVYNTLYQAQVGSPDPSTLMGNPNAGETMAAQAKATETALAKILTPDQLALYQQQAKMGPRFGRR